jgi:hypothetical protein
MGNCMCDKNQPEFHESLLIREEEFNKNSNSDTKTDRHLKKQKYENEALEFIYNSEKKLNKAITYSATEKSEFA